MENMAKAIVAVQKQQNSYLQVIDAKGEAYQVRFEKSLAQFSTELTRVITPLKDDLKQEMNLKLAELRIWIITTGIAFIAAILTLLVSNWETLGNALCQVRFGGPLAVIVLTILVMFLCGYLLFQSKSSEAREKRLEAKVNQLSQTGTAASAVSPA